MLNVKNVDWDKGEKRMNVGWDKMLKTKKTFPAKTKQY
jgi:hypothetical protein